MSENAWTRDEPATPAGGSPTPGHVVAARSLRDRLQREFAAAGSNLAAVLDDLDRVRRPDGPSRDEIMAALSWAFPADGHLGL